jgi:hypothetical protein
MINIDLKNKIYSKVLQLIYHTSTASVFLWLQIINWIFHNYLSAVHIWMFSDTDVAPEATVEPALHTVQFVPAAVGICVGVAWGWLHKTQILR